MNNSDNLCKECGQRKSDHVPVTLRCFPGSEEYFDDLGTGIREMDDAVRDRIKQAREKLEQDETRIAAPEAMACVASVTVGCNCHSCLKSRAMQSYCDDLTAAYLEASGKLQEELKLAIEQRNHEQRCVEQKQRLIAQGVKHTKWHAERAERFRKERDAALASSNRNEHALNLIQEIAEECVSNPGCELDTVDLVKKMATLLKGCKIS